MHIRRTTPARRTWPFRAAGALLASATLVAAALFVLHEPDPVGPAGDWDLSFSDDFDGSELAADKWNDHEPWQGDGWSTNAAHYRVPHTDEQLEVADGVAELRARRAADARTGGQLADVRAGPPLARYDQPATR